MPHRRSRAAAQHPGLDSRAPCRVGKTQGPQQLSGMAVRAGLPSPSERAHADHGMGPTSLSQPPTAACQHPSPQHPAGWKLSALPVVEATIEWFRLGQQVCQVGTLRALHGPQRRRHRRRLRFGISIPALVAVGEGLLTVKPGGPSAGLRSGAFRVCTWPRVSMQRTGLRCCQGRGLQRRRCRARRGLRDRERRGHHRGPACASASAGTCCGPHPSR